MYNGSVRRYKAKAGQEAYETHKSLNGRHYDFISKSRFMSYVSTHFFENGWSMDACVGRALISGDFLRSCAVLLRRELIGQTIVSLAGVLRNARMKSLRKS